MKSTTLPSLRVEPAFRQDAENVLNDGETLSSFMEDAIKLEVRRRKTHKDFLQRARVAEAEAEATGKWYSAEEVMADIHHIISAATAKQAS